MDDDLDEIELHQAFLWDCDACGAENFARAILVEDPRAIAQAKARHPEWEGVLLRAPERVRCHACRSDYRVATGGS